MQPEMLKEEEEAWGKKKNMHTVIPLFSFLRIYSEETEAVVIYMWRAWRQIYIF